MTETLDPMDQLKMDHQQLAQQLLAQARAGGVELVGPNGLLNQLTANVLEPALDAKWMNTSDTRNTMSRGEMQGNGRRAKTVLKEIGPVEIGADRMVRPPLGPAYPVPSSGLPS